MAEFTVRAEATKRKLENLRTERQVKENEQSKMQRRVNELRTYSGVLKAEIDRFTRATSTSEVFADLRVTNCPVPLQLADGASIRDKENYLVEPFVALCSKPNMENAQFIAAGHAFEGLSGANQVPIARPPDIPITGAVTRVTK